eukprot:jgi/Botrbrau1/12869/Bobra.0188s0011.1
MSGLGCPLVLKTLHPPFRGLLIMYWGKLAFLHSTLTTFTFFSDSWEDHLMHIRLVFQKLSDNNIKLGRPKCIFGASSVKALGHVVGGGVMKPDPENVAAILNLPIPRDVTMVRSVLSAASYYRTYVDKFALISEPMANLLKKNVKFEWTPECQEAFHKLKSCLTKEPLLRLPNFRKPFILTTDWSKVAIGAVLSQIDEATEFDHPVAFASRLLNSAERNYAPTEGECLALVWAIEKFRHFLDGRHFIVYTDHAALQWLNTKRHANSKLERWALRLQEYTFTVIHKKGEENLVADCLSRCVYAEALYAFAIDPVWPAGAKTQKDLDEIPCVVCGYPQGDDNIVICDGCQRCFHLRCLLPPRSLPPSGAWYCPACTPYFGMEGELKLEELRDKETPLCLNRYDPYRIPEFLDYVHSGHQLDLLKPLPPRTAADFRRRGSYFTSHPSIPGWIMVFKKVRDDIWVCTKIARCGPRCAR